MFLVDFSSSTQLEDFVQKLMYTILYFVCVCVCVCVCACFPTHMLH